MRSRLEPGDQLRLALFKRGDLGLEPSQLAGDPRELRLRLLVLQVVAPVLPLDQRLDLAPQEPRSENFNLSPCFRLLPTSLATSWLAVLRQGLFAAALNSSHIPHHGNLEREPCDHR